MEISLLLKISIIFSALSLLDWTMRRMFVKMHGAGNHFLIVEPHFFGLSNQRASINTFSQEELDSIRPRVFKLCQPNFGIGADGILVMSQGQDNIYKMTIINGIDTLVSLMCGNGLRCAAAYLSTVKQLGSQFPIFTDSGLMKMKVKRQTSNLFFVQSNLGLLSHYERLETLNFQLYHSLYKYLQGVTPYACQVGDPQIILFLSPLQFAAIQKDNAYFAIYQQLTGMSNINVNFCLVESNSVLRVITFEFGNGVTYACGTGSTASAFVGYRLGLLDPVVKVVNRGGNLMISINPQERGQYQVYMNGPAEYVFTGFVEDELK